MTVSSLSVHMLCALSMLTVGSETLRSTFQFCVLTLVIDPVLVLSLYSSIWVAIQTSPTPGTAGFLPSAGRVFGRPNLLFRYESRLGTSSGLPLSSYIRIGAGGNCGFHCVSLVSLNVCQFDGTVMLKNFSTSCAMMSASDGTASPRLLTCSFLPKS